MLTVGGTYVDDLELVDAAHVVYVRSPIAHARIASVDVAAAMAAPGVLAVLSAADCDLPSRRPGDGPRWMRGRRRTPGGQQPGGGVPFGDTGGGSDLVGRRTAHLLDLHAGRPRRARVPRRAARRRGGPDPRDRPRRRWRLWQQGRPHPRGGPGRLGSAAPAQDAA